MGFKMKKVFTFMLMCAMLFTSMPITALADPAGLVTPGQPAKLELVLMAYDEGVDDNNIDVNKGKIHEITPQQIPSSGEFLVAIRMGDLEKITEGNEGIYNANISIKYDPTYLQIEDIDTFKSSSVERVNEVKLYSRAAKYQFVEAAIGDKLSNSGDNMTRAVNMNFEFKDAQITPTFKGGDGDVLVGAVKFTKKSDAPVGTKVLDFLKSPGVYASCSFDVGGDAKYSGGGVYNMIPLYTWDVSRVNLFPAKVNLTYHDNLPPAAVLVSGSVEGQTQAVTEGTSVAESVAGGEMLPSPKVKGYIFKGWFTEADGGTEVTKDTKINAAQDLYAHWEKGYAITFNGNNGLIDGKATVDVPLAESAVISVGQVPANATVTRANYTFAGWNTKANGTGVTLANPDAVVAHNFNKTSTTLYAQWTAAGTEQVVVTFNGNGATTSPNPAQITLNKGDSIDTGMPDVDRLNYKFKEWNTKQNGTGTVVDKHTAIDTSMTVYAQWIPEGSDGEKVTVTFIDDGNTHANPTEITIRKGDKIGQGNMPNHPEKTGFSFDKWIVDTDKSGAIDNGENTEFTGDENVSNNMQVVAAWKSDVTVTFHVRNGKINGQAVTTKAITVKYGQSLADAGETLPVATSNLADYVFWAWKTKDNGGGDNFNVNTKVKKNMNVYACFQKADPGSDPSDPPVPKPDAVKIVFDKNGGDTDADPKEWYIGKNDVFNTIFVAFPTDPVRNNYKFVEWNTKKNGMGKKAELNMKPADLLTDPGAKELKLYAQWTVGDTVEPNKKVKVDFLWNDDGAHSTPYRTIKLYKGDAVGESNVPDAPVRDGYSFDKWVYVNGGADFDPTAAVNADIQVKATWKKQVSVKFYRNDVNAQPDKTLLHTKILNTGDTFESTDMPANPDSRAGYKFVRWETADGVEFTGGTISADTKVYAQWAKEVQFTFDNATVIYNGAVQKLANPSISDMGGMPVNLTLGDDYTVSYAKKDAPGVPVQPKDAGEYVITVNIVDKNNTVDTYEINKVLPTVFTIQKKSLQFKVDSDQTVKTDGSSSKPISISCKTVAPVSAFVIKYALWTDNNKDGKIANSELSAFKEEAPKAHGKYVVKVDINDKENYVIELNGWVEGDVYNLNSDYADGEAPTVGGQNLKYALVPNAELSGLTVKDVATSKHLDLYGVPKDIFEVGDKVPFAPDTLDYYVSVKDGQKIKVELEGSLPDDAGTVEISVNNGKVELTGDENAKATGELTLNPLDPNVSTPAERFSNIVAIKVGDKTYTLHVRQLLKPQIKLNYGNSPYGEIMRDDAIVDKEAAKNAFNIKNKYSDGFVPNRVQSVMNEKYAFATRAWVDINNVANISAEEAAKIANPEINLDRDPYALFVYNNKTFKDSGFTATDSLGKPINEVDCKVEYKRAGGSDIKGMQTDKLVSATYSEKHSAAGSEVTKLTYKYTGTNGRFIAPDAYDMKYSFRDAQSGEEVTVIRKLVVISLLGDTDLDGEITASDKNFINIYLANGDVPSKDKYSMNIIRMYLYRIVGTATDANELTANDKNAINKWIAEGIGIPVQMYMDID